jgi:hypothetical protein
MNTENQHPEKTECDGISCPVCGRVGTRKYDFPMLCVPCRKKSQERMEVIRRVDKICELMGIG